MPEIPLLFPNSRGETLVGVQHAPAQTPRGALLFLHGWSGYRTGPHQMLTRAARHFGARGWASLRFDFAGRGDSEGDTETATLATMRDDCFDALKLLRAEVKTGPIVAVGLCSGCEIAVAAARQPWDGIALWSAPIFAALPEESGQDKKRAANLGKYARKLLNPQTYLKIARGEVDTAAVGKAMKGGGGAASKNVESNQAGQLPPGFRAQSLAHWKNYDGSVLQIYGDADPIAPDARAWYEKHSATSPRVETVAGANHSFYGLEWERQVFELTEGWLDENWRASHIPLTKVRGLSLN